MNNKYILLSLLSINVLLPTKRHLPHDHSDDKNTKTAQEIANKKLHHTEKRRLCRRIDSSAPDTLIDFATINGITCQDFIKSIIQCYALDDKKELLPDLFLTFTPEQAWSTLNNEEYFTCKFIHLFNHLYSKEEFILLYKTRLTIEFMIFALNPEEKSLHFKYHYWKNPELRKVLENLLEFIQKADYLLENKLTPNQIDSFKNFLLKYVTQRKAISLVSFLQELAEFQILLNVFLVENNNKTKPLGMLKKMTMINRFSNILK